MTNIEIPVGKRTLKYRLLEMLPATLSYGAFLLLIVLSLLNVTIASVYLLVVIISLLVKAVGITFHIVTGDKSLNLAKKVDWRARLAQLETPIQSYKALKDTQTNEFNFKEHIDNLALISRNLESFPKPSQIYNAVIIASYNESYDVIAPTIETVINTAYDKKKMIIVLAYEERGGAAIESTAKKLQSQFGDYFFDFHIVKHPKDIPNEVIGKGGNITYAGKFLQKWLKQKNIPSKDVIVTTLDADNKTHRDYFDYLTYEYIVHEDRKRLSFQPVSLFLNNIWDVPAPMRVVATGNSFWNIISSMRPHSLRNFASHAQPMDALEEMNFWSTRTIVEDGHQYWRSYFHFDGDYSVVPLFVPIYQDAVLSNTYFKTLKAQFIQLRRWAYGASDVAYVGSLLFSKDRKVPFWGGLARFLRLVDGHVTLASVSIMVAFGGWVPLLLYGQSARSLPAHQLPDVISVIQRVAMVGLFIMVFLSFKMLPPRPERYKKSRTVGMLFQWILMPVTAIAYSSTSALYSQGRLFLGRYLDKFDVTEKATHKTVAETKQQHKQEKNKSK